MFSTLIENICLQLEWCRLKIKNGGRSVVHKNIQHDKGYCKFGNFRENFVLRITFKDIFAT